MSRIHYVQCAECQQESFLPTGEYRPAYANEHYLLMEKGSRGNQTEMAFQHLDNMPDNVPVVILRRVKSCACASSKVGGRHEGGPCPDGCRHTKCAKEVGVQRDG